MNNDTKGGCLAIVLGGIVFILGPIVVILYGLISAPIGMKVFLLAWIIFVIVCNAFISDKSTRIALSIIPTVIYAFSFATWYADDVLEGYFGGGGLGDTIGMFLLACITVVPLIIIGNWFRSANEAKRQERQQKKIQLITDAIHGKRNDLRILNESLIRKGRIDTLINLLSICGAETQALKSHSMIADVLISVRKKEQIIGEIKSLEEELKKLQGSL